MKCLGKLLRPTATLGLILFCSIAWADEKIAATTSELEATPEVDLLILEFNNLPENPTARLTSRYQRWGPTLNQKEVRASIEKRIFEVRDGRLLVIEFEILADEEVVEEGYFLVGREVHSELLGSEGLGITARSERLADRVVVDIPLPFHREAQELRLAHLEVTNLQTWEQAERHRLVPISLETLMMNPYAPDVANAVVGTEVLAQAGGPEKLDIVFLGDGFVDGRSMAFYRHEVDRIVERLFQTHPFGALKDAFNIYRVDVVSGETGIDVAAGCESARPETDRDNALKSHFCTLSESGTYVYYLLGFENESLIRAFADAAFSSSSQPDYADQIIVLANSRDFGGAGYRDQDLALMTVWSSKGMAPADAAAYSGKSEAPDRRSQIHASAIHELGHSEFDLGDEYCMSLCCGSPCIATDTDYPYWEPSQQNLTKQVQLGQLKWKHLVVASEIDIPTHEIPGCPGVPATTGTPTAVVYPPQDLVGLYEGGGGYGYSCGIFRPSPYCAMNCDHREPFCPVCRDQIIKQLSKYLDRLYVSLDTAFLVPLPNFGTATAVDFTVSPVTAFLSPLGASQSGTLQLAPPASAESLIHTDALLGEFSIPQLGRPELLKVTLAFRYGPGVPLGEVSLEIPSRTGIHIKDVSGRRLTFSIASPVSRF